MHLIWQMLKYMWYWPNWIGNISADIIVTIVVSILWRKLRKTIKIWLHINVTENLKEHIDNHMLEVHKKLDKNQQGENNE